MTATLVPPSPRLSSLLRTLLPTVSLHLLASGSLAAWDGERNRIEAPTSGSIITLNPFLVQEPGDPAYVLPGAVSVITPTEIQRFQSDDLTSALRRVPGVYVRPEDGYGLFPNISLRGVDSLRSAKLTLMEDGVLTAPAPYSAPAAYYSPTLGRMHAVEVLKGTSQIRYGPQTTGGAINYLSTPLPQEGTEGRIKVAYGTDEEIRIHTNYGQEIETGVGQFSYLVEMFHRENNGFKEVDGDFDSAGNRTYSGSDDTGIERTDWMLKTAFVPESGPNQRFEIKVGYSDSDADVSYLGLNDEDFEEDPYRRYQASRLDNFTSYHTRTYLRHFIQTDDGAALTTTAYYNRFHRNWYKLHDFRGVDMDGDGTIETSSAERYSLGAAVATQEPLEVLRGDRAGIFRIRANNRHYELYGIQSRLNLYWDRLGADHDTEFGVRVHKDYIRRFQFNDTVTQDTEGVWTDISRGAPGGAGDRRQETVAYAAHASNQADWGRFTLTTGLRYEYVEFDYVDFSTDPDETGEIDMSVWAPGLGATFEITEGLLLFGGVYRGFSLPGPRAAARSEIGEETSTASELGLRYRNPDLAATAEVVLFYTALEDLVADENLGGTGGEVGNFGSVNSYGIESKFTWDPAAARECEVRTPLEFSFTYTNATFDGNEATSTDPDSIFAGAEDGHHVPYIPEWQAAFSAGLEWDRFRGYAGVTWTDETFTTASNTEEQFDLDSNPDARFGTTDSYFLVDLSAYFKIRENLELFGTVKNVLDEEYVVSRHPYGARPGPPRQFLAGLDFTF